MVAYKIDVRLDINSEIKRTVIIPGNITFKKLHEIICILFNLNNNKKYKFIFEDLDLIIHDTGSLNIDTIDARFELIDAYFLRYTSIKYVNDIWNIKINNTKTKYEKEYPQLLEIKGNLNPTNKIKSTNEYLTSIKQKDKNLNEIRQLKTQSELISLFNIPHTIENNRITILNEDETLEKYIK